MSDPYTAEPAQSIMIALSPEQAVRLLLFGRTDDGRVILADGAAEAMAKAALSWLKLYAADGPAAGQERE